jgi:hypothetical protein
MAVTNYYSVEDELIAQYTAGSSRLDYLTDSLGSVNSTVDNTATLVNSYQYKPFGGLLSQSGTGVTPAYLWQGSVGCRQTGNNYSEVSYSSRGYSVAQGVLSIYDLATGSKESLGMQWGHSIARKREEQQNCAEQGKEELPCQKDPCKWVRYNSPEEQRSELKAKEAGLKHGGFVACCGGNYTPCTWWVGPQMPWFKCVKKCIIHHENQHILQNQRDNRDCPDGPIKYESDWRRDAYECEAWALTVNCIKNAKELGTGKPGAC